MLPDIVYRYPPHCEAIFAATEVRHDACLATCTAFHNLVVRDQRRVCTGRVRAADGHDVISAIAASGRHDGRAHCGACNEGLGAQGAAGDLKPQMFNQGVGHRAGRVIREGRL